MREGRLEKYRFHAQDSLSRHVFPLSMRYEVVAERKAFSEFDTAVRSLSTLRHPGRGGEDGFETRTLLADVQLAVRATATNELRRVAATDAGLAFQPRGLLSLLVYCYATGTFSSADIEDMMRKDVTFRDLCHGEFPSARHLQRFRRENRSAVRDCLLRVLQRQHRSPEPPEGTAGRVSVEEGLQEEADRRVAKATFIDHMETEND
jgi:hypothetical protein